MDNDSQKLISALKEMWYKMDSLYDLYAKSVGLNFPTILVLYLLCDSAETYTQKGLSEKLGLPKQFVNSIMKSFWEQGYVELKEAKDRRNKHIILTDKGKEYASSVLMPLEEAESIAWASFSAEEIKNLAKTTEKYNKAFEIALESIAIHGVKCQQ
jgi:DNA-binding MarR family transcriptional regulator